MSSQQTKYDQALTPEVIERFKTAIETGRWPDGRKLSPQQVQTCMEAVIRFEHLHVPAEERTGYVPPKKNPCGPETDEAEQALSWRSGGGGSNPQ